jgi:hypothetical protein
MRLYMGQARDVLCRRMVEYKEVRDVRGNLDNLEVRIRYEIENFKKQPVRLDIIEQLNRVADQFYPGGRHGEVDWERGPRTSEELDISYEYGGANPVLHVSLPARPGDDERDASGEPAPVKKTVVTFDFTIKNLWK